MTTIWHSIKSFVGNSQLDDRPDIRFGRYTDAYKSNSRYDAWDSAVSLFDQQRYVQSYEQFLLFLQNEKEDNLEYAINEGKIHFALLQGSKRIEGTSDGKVIKAEAKIAHALTFEPELLQKLLEYNFGLQYTRYAIDPDDMLTITFHSSVLDASPYKLYYGLKEMALHSDKQDDLLTFDYTELEAINTGHILLLPAAEIDIKYRFFKAEISQSLAQAQQLDLPENDYPGAYSYLYLDLIYRLDYLLKPEGKSMQAIESIHKRYFGQQTVEVSKRNRKIKTILEELAETKPQHFEQEMYAVTATFGVMPHTTFVKMRDTIIAELPDMDWYMEHGHDAVAVAIPSYIMGYLLFTSAIPLPVRDLFELYFQLRHPGYFEELGFAGKYVSGATLHGRTIKRRIKKIIKSHQADFEALEVDMSSLDFSNLATLGRTMLMMIAQMECEAKAIGR